MTSNPTVRKLSFTGSTDIGRMLMKQVAPTVKKISLELGGNAPFIVFDDADLDAAADGAIISKYRNTGQTCVCANRLFVHDKVYDAFAAKLSERVRALKVGAGNRARRDAGPADQSRGAGQGRGARRGRHRARRESGGRRQAPCAGRDILRADGADRRHRGHEDLHARRPSVRSRRCSASRPTRK